MRCPDLLRWLDDGSPTRDAADAFAHAGSCSACAHALRAARAVDALLAASPPAPPRGFVDRTLGAARAAGRVRLPQALAIAPTDSLPWWVRAAAEPAVALSLILCALFLWRGDLLTEAAFRVVAWVALIESAFHGGRLLHDLPRISFESDPVVAAGVIVALAPLGLGLGYALYRGTRSLVITLALRS